VCRSELGYLFPPVMGKMVENHVQSRWLKWRNTGCVDFLLGMYIEGRAIQEIGRFSILSPLSVIRVGKKRRRSKRSISNWWLMLRYS
jgi:hypothetical protein